MKNYFGDIIHEHKEVLRWLKSEILPEALALVPEKRRNVVAVHIRLGDYLPPFLADVSWYENIIKSMLTKVGHSLDIELYSDGTDEQLKTVLAINGVHRAFYGNALADIIAISRCRFLIGSDSTFSGWGAYLGQVPCIYPHLHYSHGGCMLKDASKCKICNDPVFPDEFLTLCGGEGMIDDGCTKE